MAKCTKCGKKGLFLKVDKNGICSDCAHKAQLEERDKKIAELNEQLLPEQRDINKLKEKIAALTVALETKEKEIAAAKITQQQINTDIKNKKKELIVLDDELLYQSFSLYKPIYDFAKSEDYKDRLNSVREKQKAMIKNNTVCSANWNWTVNGSAAQGKKMIRDSIKMMVRCFNTECENVIDRVKCNNIESMRKRINTMYDQINKLNVVNEIRIAPAYRNLKIDELNLAYEYQLKKQKEKEEIKEQKARLREQAKLEKEIREAREQLNKDRRHFQRALADAQAKLASASDVEKELYQEKINELTQQLDKLDKDEKAIDYREKNAKAGYVYIISNIGAFGDGVYKIGMTRRLEPEERIDELSGAAVPFDFDIHAMIFSDNAPDLEAKLHKHFEKDRVNKINGRKEFYRTNIDEIEKVVKANYDKTIEINKVPEAEQFRESQQIEKALTQAAADKE